jgi:transcriptional regulator with XRE-family HTH domain
MGAAAKSNEVAGRAAKRLRAFRERSGLTREQAAVFGGISYGGLEHIEAGRVFPRVDTLIRLAHLYGVTIDEIVDPADYDLLVPQSLELLGRRFAQSLPQDAAATAAGEVAPLQGKGKRRSSTRSTAAASRTQQAASAAAAGEPAAEAKPKRKRASSLEIAPSRSVGRVGTVEAGDVAASGQSRKARGAASMAEGSSRQRSGWTSM